MFDPTAEPPSAEYLLRANSIMNSIAAGASGIPELSFATALPVTTILRVAAILVDQDVLHVFRVGEELHLAIKQRMQHP